MRIIGLTGSIACGKSTVSAYLKSRGFPVIDGDQLSRELTVAGSPALLDIRRVFGDSFLLPDGTLNRRRLGDLVFSDPMSLQKLDDLMAPYLLSLTEERLEETRRSGSSLCFLDMPLLFEKGYDRYCDTVWTVWLPQEIQLSRLMERDQLSREDAMSRISAVMSSDEKADRANRIIDNSGKPDETIKIVAGLLDEELLRARMPRRSRRSPAVQPDSGAQEVPQISADSCRKEVTVPPVSVSAAPEMMDRPSAAKRRPSARKVAWRLPVWIKTSLIVLSAVILLDITALSLLNAYLRGQEELHLEEQAAIDNQYPLLYRDYIEYYAAEFNLSPAFVSAVIRNESSFQARAESGVGARGLMQLMPDTADWIAHKLGVEGYAFERMNDPESNIRFGCWYLNYLSKQFLGDPVCVTAAYHAGQGQVKVWLSDPLLSEDGYTMPLASLPDGPTKNYVRKVTRDYGIYQEKYFSPDSLLDVASGAASF